MKTGPAMLSMMEPVLDLRLMGWGPDRDQVATYHIVKILGGTPFLFHKCPNLSVPVDSTVGWGAVRI